MNEEMKIQVMNGRNQEGFSYIDVIIAMVIFLIGILGMTEALAFNRMRAQLIEKQLTAKQLVLSSMESVLAAKELNPDAEVTGWDTIGNVGFNNVNGVNRGIFETDFRPVRLSPGDDGIIGTVDDACTGNSACGTNNSPLLPGLDRKIEIEDIPSLDYIGIRQRTVKVTVRYQSNGRIFQESIKTIVTDYR